MQAAFNINAGVDTPVSAYIKLRELEPRYLLEYASSDTQKSRYAYLGFGGALDLRLNAQGLSVGSQSQPYPADHNAFLKTIREALAQTPALKPQIPGLPFSGGLVGLSGYDVVRLFQQEKGFSGNPSTMLHAAYCATTSLLVFDRVTNRFALLHSGSDAEREHLHQQVVQLLGSSVPARKYNTNVPQADPGVLASVYVERVQTCQKHIASGELEQVVISMPFTGQSKVEPFEVYRTLRLLNPSPYMYFFDFGDLKVVGASPEQLTKLKGRDASLRPIAGTLPRGKSREKDLQNEKDLLADPKEASEHEMLVELAKADLSQVTQANSIKVDPHRSIERYSHVMHIVSGVHGKLLPGMDAFDLFAASLPAGTLVGKPKDCAMQTIEKIETSPRGLYSGAAGYFASNGNMDHAITIRTIVFEGDTYSYQAGGGVVADSVPKNEYQEVLDKTAVLHRALALAAKGL